MRHAAPHVSAPSTSLLFQSLRRREHRRQAAVAVRLSEVPRRESILPCNSAVRTRSEEHLRSGQVPMLGREHERGGTFAVNTIDVSTRSNEELDDIGPPRIAYMSAV